MLYLDLGLIEYQRAWELQKRIVRMKIRGLTQDFLLILEHPPTVTLGLRADNSHLTQPKSTIEEKDIAVVEVDRGGSVTYHGPGQVVCYPVLNLRAMGLSVRAYVRKLEQVIEGSLISLGVEPARFPGRPGIWADSDRKIASIGVRIVSRIAYHGFSINVQLEDSPEDFVILCGMPTVVMTDLRRLKERDYDMQAVKALVAERFAEVFGVCLQPIALQQCEGQLGMYGE